VEAVARSITFLGNEGSVKIPYFQRSYVWGRDNWEDMLTELLEFSKSHFLGSLILKQMTAKTGLQKSVLVIDGQQRLTTISILLKVIYDLFSSEMKMNTSSELLKYLFFKKNVTDEKYHIKIDHSRADSVSFKKIIGEVKDGLIQSLDSKELVNINDGSNKILQCYKYFYEELESKEEGIKKALFENLLNSENKIIVLIDLTEHDNEQAIFDTINSAGVRLSGTDIVKNALFQRTLEIMDNDKVMDLYKNCWEDVFTDDDAALTYWSARKITGRLERDQSELLLQTIAIIKGIYDPEKHTLAELPDLYKEKIRKASEDELSELINEIKEYAQIYRENIPDFDRDTLYSFSDYKQRLFHILDICETSTFHPYIIYLLKEYNNNESALIERLKVLEQFVIKRMITKKETKSYNKLCKDFINNENALNDKNNEIQNDDIAEGISSISNRNAALILFWIELHRRHIDTKQAVKELKYNYSLEHLMPQKWEEYWSNVPVYDENGIEEKDFDKAKVIRYKKIYSLGNMTLLNTRLNISLRNYVFERKIEGEGRKKGIRHYSELWITKQDILDKYDDGDIDWNEKSITEREKALCIEIIKIWNS
jgi:hypothetical protein